MARRNRFRTILDDPDSKPLIVAHRGESSLAPENTIEAARLGHRAGAAGWEFDVQLTADGVPIVIHDPSLVRTTDVTEVFRDDPRGRHDYQVADFRLDEIRRLEAGRWFLKSGQEPRSANWFGTLDGLDVETVKRCEAGEVLIPTLEDALALTVDLGWLANVEIKSDHSGSLHLIDAVLDLVARLGVADRLLVSSFDHAEVARVARSGLDLATGVLVTSPLHDPAGYVRHLGADAYHVAASCLGVGGARYRHQPSSAGLRRSDLNACRDAGVPVLVYTVNDVEVAGHLAGAGVTGIFTDRPADFSRLMPQARASTNSRRDDTGPPSVAREGAATGPTSRSSPSPDGR